MLEQLKERLKKLESEREQLRTNLIAYEGAIQECQHWIAEYTKKVEEAV